MAFVYFCLCGFVKELNKGENVCKRVYVSVCVRVCSCYWEFLVPTSAPLILRYNDRLLKF
jgi:hypothetical protein